VARDSTITATFDEDMFATTVDASSFTLDKSGTINGTVTFEANTNVATFTPSRELDINAIYTATLSTDINDLSGNPLVADYNWSFTTAEGSWGTTEKITTDTTAGSDDPQVSLDSSGNAIAVWSQYNGSVNDIYSNRFDGNDWGTAEPIETGAGSASSRPQVAFDSSGNAIAVWRQNESGGFSIWANRFDGNDWGIAELIETSAGGAEFPQIAVSSNGNAIAVWQQEDSSGDPVNIWANHFDVNRSGGPGWGTAELIETNDDDALEAQVGIDGNGHAIAVWRQSDGSGGNVKDIWTNRFDDNGWGDVEQIETGTGQARGPQVGVNSSGDAIAVWRQSDGGFVSVWANRFSGTSWGTAELIETSTFNVSDPQVSLDSSGNAIAVWSQFNGSVVDIYSNRFDVNRSGGAGWGTAELIETGTGGSAVLPQIALNSSGNGIAVWFQSDGSDDNVKELWANRFDGTSWGTAALIEIDNSARDGKNAQVSVDSSGNAIAVWSQIFDGSIYANRFE
jgi:hypothetical protein